ncbi:MULTISPECIES: autotransporter outer membrane beta-barrel domain-containing protein [Bradyrhizobium]|uniref:Uncharacterized conserved protein, contains a C-terminal beta-barrel porin domain n=2 Tax=Bradyrhizobium TaxID=374 RepID=A0ABY0Q0T2_9BRAD|nr:MULTISPECIES: autotransporter outer membrane beta-barrel domain-containing protein [Bradyrhizobium]SDJ24781.1 Uncharacterized conserved protein, contains a C-terminal beta-barrel porin domain [Bradyrhizobium ottawaense]SEC77279.1 Uncharacterized conserved protein, contains a C-terminal beta-barrel porin domain [Bradyrhizobium lablabi]SHK89173.1 Uncharacterized conserved protein, contains a C-terminal beta-barrel porin domain [Bradyrhizobium lablabi]
MGGTFSNSATGTVSGAELINLGTATNAGTINNGVGNGGSFTNSGTVNGGVGNSTFGTVTNTGTVNGALNNSFGTYNQTAGTTNGGTSNSGTINANGGAFNGAIVNANGGFGGIFNIGGTVTSDSTFNNSTGTSRLVLNSGTYTVAGLITNSGTNAGGGIRVLAGATLTANGDITNNPNGRIVNNGTVNGVLNNNGVVDNFASYNGNLTNTGTLANHATGTWTGNIISNTATLIGITNDGIWAGNVQANTGKINNNLTWNGTVNNTFVFTNNAAGTVTVLVTNNGGGAVTTTGTLANGLANSGIVFAQGTINGGITNNAGGINITGALVGNSTVNNAAGATININNQSFTGNTTYTNDGTTNLGGGGAGTLGVTSLVNTANGTFNSSGTTGTVTATSITNSGTFLNNGTTTGTFTMAAGNLIGTGNTQSLTVNGGTFAPGNGTAGTSMTVTGSLVLQAAATYLVQINPTTASFTNVTGAASLGGASVSANFAAGSYISKRYTIVTAAGGRIGTFGALVTTGQPASMNSTLSYDANNAYLNLNLSFGLPGTLNQNQQNVGNALTGFFNRTGGIPAAFASLNAGQLTQADGETATGSQQSTFNAMNQFMGVMTDPFVAGRGDPVSAGGGATGYADEQAMAYAAKRNPNDALAAIYTKAPPVVSFQQRWSVWAAGYGGSQTTSGNAVLGSNNTSSNLYGVAVGADYRFSPDTLAGFALAGGGTNFSVANNLGSGRSDLFQAGAFIRHNMGAAYLSGALAYGWQDITTNRTLTIAGVDQLQAKFNANAWSGRVEGGYRFVTQGIGITPYAAGQFTTFDLPAYVEQAISGANTFALAYGAKSVTATRSELGLRTDKSFAMEDGVFTLRGRAAWAHDYNPDRAIGATFQTLPGASFVVNGARQASDTVLLTASAEKKWLNGWSAAGTFEGEFSSVTTSYAGKGVVRYAW